MMGDLGHEPAPCGPAESAATQARNSRVGLWLFSAYFLMYAAFVLLNAFRPLTMDGRPLWGLNLAVLYGLALIIAAIVLALVYAWVCRNQASTPGKEGRAA